MGLLLQGIGLGLVLATLVGPIFFSLIQTSIKNGFKNAVIMSVGITISDIIYILLIYFGIAQLSENQLFIKLMGICGGGILIITGIVALFKKNKVADTNNQDLQEQNIFKYFLKGFTLNFINPAVFLFWAGAVGVVSLDNDYNNWNVALFFIGTVATVFSTDILKAYVAGRLTKFLNDRILNIISKISGIAMIAFGLKLMIEKLIV